jgi:hypothetical protein
VREVGVDGGQEKEGFPALEIDLTDEEAAAHCTASCAGHDLRRTEPEVIPPSMTSSAPVIWRDTSEARNRTPLAIS